MRIARAGFAMGFCVVLISACGSDDTKKAPTNYDLRFPSIDVAVATDTIEVFVFDPLAKETRICEELLVKQRSQQDLGQWIARLPPTPLCDVLSGNTAPVDVGFGTWAFFAVAQRSSTDYLLGCTLANVGPGTEKPVITFSYASSTAPPAPPTTCLDVTQKCKRACE